MNQGLSWQSGGVCLTLPRQGPCSMAKTKEEEKRRGVSQSEFVESDVRVQDKSVRRQARRSPPTPTPSEPSHLLLLLASPLFVGRVLGRKASSRW